MGLNEFSLMLRALTYTHIQHFLLTAWSSYLHNRPEIDTLFSLFVCVCVCVCPTKAILTEKTQTNRPSWHPLFRVRDERK